MAKQRIDTHGTSTYDEPLEFQGRTFHIGETVRFRFSSDPKLRKGRLWRNRNGVVEFLTSDSYAGGGLSHLREVRKTRSRKPTIPYPKR